MAKQAQRDSIEMVKQIQRDSIEAALKDSLANRPVNILVKEHALKVYGENGVKDISVFDKGISTTSAHFKVYRPANMTSRLTKMSMIMDAFSLFQKIFEDPACADVDEILIFHSTDMVDFKGNEHQGVAVKIQIPRLTGVNYTNLGAKSMIKLVEREGKIWWFGGFGKVEL